MGGTASEILSRPVLDERVLRSRCLLDHGRHRIKPTKGLDTLDTLAFELLQEVLSYLDVRSMLVFRRVNQRSMETVNAMVEWSKVTEIFDRLKRMIDVNKS